MIVKICGMRDQEALDAASSCGANMAGFIFAPGSPRFLAPDEAARLNSGPLLRVGVFTQCCFGDDAGGDATADLAESILDIAARARLDFLQLHGCQPESLAEELAVRRGTPYPGILAATLR